MRAGILAAAAAAFLVAAGAAWAGCPPGPARGCVNLDLAPQTSRDIVAGDRLSAPSKTVPTNAGKSPYTGPTVGFSDRVRRAPEIGYRWAID
jgi:hypothetical protein